MKVFSCNLWEGEKYGYPMACGFIPTIHGYLHEENASVRPCMLVVPGGGYFLVSPTEAEIVALKFYKEGYNAFVWVFNFCSGLFINFNHLLFYYVMWWLGKS